MGEPPIDPDVRTRSSVGAVVVRLDAVAADAAGLPALAFLRAAIARRVALVSATIELGGAPPLPVGLAAVDGRLVTLIGVGALRPRGPVVLCDRPGGEPVAVAVDEVVATGVFPLRDGVVALAGGDVARELHLAPLVARVEETVWAPRAGAASSAPSATTSGAAAPRTTRPR